MTFYVENETEYKPDAFDPEQILGMVMKQTLKQENCPYENVSVNLLITDHEGIREYNREYRDMDKETDVLSFPNLDFASPADFSYAEDQQNDCFDPDTGELCLGDIIINYERVISQAAEYGHSEKREFAFLVAHSMLHLCGYDHMEKEEAKVMEDKQASVLNALGITRD